MSPPGATSLSRASPPKREYKSSCFPPRGALRWTHTPPTVGRGLNKHCCVVVRYSLCGGSFVEIVTRGVCFDAHELTYAPLLVLPGVSWT